MPGLDVSEILRSWKPEDEEKERDEAREAVKAIRDKAETAIRRDRAEELVDNNIGDPSLEHELRVAAGSGSSNNDAETQRLMNIARGKRPVQQEPDPEKDEDDDRLEKRPSASEYQRRLAAMLSNALAVRNVQKLVIINNRANLKRGLSQVTKPSAKGQMSTITIPTVLLRRVQQEVGALSAKANQNEVMTGFLFWYFGQPEEVSFPSDDAYARVKEITGNLDETASPARAGKAGNSAVMEMRDMVAENSSRLDAMFDLYQKMSSLFGKLDRKVDSATIAAVYAMLNGMGSYTPVMGPGQPLDTVDVLAGGNSFTILELIHDATDYISRRDGRRIYEAKFKKAASPYTYASDKPKYGQQVYQDPEPDEPDYNDEDEGDDDDYYGYESLPYVDDIPDDEDGYNEMSGGEDVMAEADYGESGDDDAAADLIKRRREAKWLDEIGKNFTGKVINGDKKPQ